MVTVSLSMIVKNEEDTIGRCLESVKELVDEIIIVDTGSTDKTKEVAKQYTDFIFDFHWIDNFAAARNFSFEKANMDYILWLDADDILLEKDRKEFLDLKNRITLEIDSVSMIYNLEMDSNGNVISSLRRNRMVKRQKNFKWHGAVHEYLEVDGNILNSEIAVTHSSLRHDSERNLRIFENQIGKGEEFSPRDLYYYANELYDHQKYEQAIDTYKKFLETNKGWIEDNISACGNLADSYHHFGDSENERQYILKSFEYDTPRAEFCCRLGYSFLEKKQPHQAIFWYNLATKLEKPIENWGKINHACWTWLPHLMLSYCHAQIGNIEIAYNHTEEAHRYLPNHPSILENKTTLELILQQRELKKKAENWMPIAAQVDQDFCPEEGSKKLRITFLMDHMNICGGVKSALEYSNNLVKRGHQVNIVCPDPEPNWMNIDATYIQVPTGVNLVEYIPDSDVIITTFWKQMVTCYLAQKAPIIHFEQGDTYIFEFNHYDQERQDEWKMYWSVPVPVIAVSSGLAEQIEKNFQRKPRILNYALNNKVFFPRKKVFFPKKTNLPKSTRPRIMFVGPEQWPFKGISDIKAAIKKVQELGYEVEPVWVTQFQPESPFEGTLYISPTQEQLGELYRTADLFICGSYYESFGLPPLEAMTCGCPVISTRNIGVLEYAEHDKNCLLINIGDPSDLAAAIIELLEDEERRTQLVKAGYKTAAKFQMENVMDHFEKLLYGALHRKKLS